MIGCGYLGAVHAACMADLGHEVVGVDVDAGEDRDARRRARAVLRARSAGAAARARWRPGGSPSAPTSRPHAARRCTSSPSAPRSARTSYAADLDLRRRGRRRAAAACSPPATSSSASRRCPSAPPRGSPSSSRRVGARLAWNPEFLREGFAVRTPSRPTGSCYGVRAGGRRHPPPRSTRSTPPRSRGGTPRVVTDFATAELVKVAANAFLATKISFINAMAEVARGDRRRRHPARRRDRLRRADRPALPQRGPRVRRRLPAQGHPRASWRAPRSSASTRRSSSCARSTRSTCAVASAWSTSRREVLRRRASRASASRCSALAFKPDSDDVRDSPALDVAARLAELGAEVVGDRPGGDRDRAAPAARPALRRRPPRRRPPAPTPCCCSPSGSSTASSTPSALGSLVAARAIVDGRNCLDPAQWRAAGWTYRALGRP